MIGGGDANGHKNSAHEDHIPDAVEAGRRYARETDRLRWRLDCFWPADSVRPTKSASHMNLVMKLFRTERIMNFAGLMNLSLRLTRYENWDPVYEIIYAIV